MELLAAIIIGAVTVLLLALLLLLPFLWWLDRKREAERKRRWARLDPQALADEYERTGRTPDWRDGCSDN